MGTMKREEEVFQMKLYNLHSLCVRSEILLVKSITYIGWKSEEN